ncbi:protein SPEC3-like [Anneissia japonica]|uniref:protein SPEC3-like n=1 Tax=Anneissia japonica TaxID=1529436 RepID=UPI00142554D5|nr:protein SPEC3-like [Anneissia japonica]
MAAPYGQPPPPQAVTTVTVVQTEKKPNACRAAIPAMHIAMAVVCLIFNIFIPGLGTIIAAFAVFCCANTGQSGGGKVGTFCLNFWVGLLQLATCWIFFIGWIWSIMWGAAFIGMSADYHSSGDATTTVVTTTSAVPQQQQMMVVTQPQPPPYNQQPPPPTGQPMPPQAMPGQPDYPAKA